MELLANESCAGFTLVGTPRRVKPDLELALYRIAQESLSNARRHAQATQVEVTLVFAPNQVRLTVSDDGVGFTLPADFCSLARSGHFGLMGMQERANWWVHNSLLIPRLTRVPPSPLLPGWVDVIYSSMMSSRIMPISACSRIWQWYMKRPA